MLRFPTPCSRVTMPKFPPPRIAQNRSAFWCASAGRGMFSRMGQGKIAVPGAQVKPARSSGQRTAGKNPAEWRMGDERQGTDDVGGNCRSHAGSHCGVRGK
jgi:hypothetical protein